LAKKQKRRSFRRVFKRSGGRHKLTPIRIMKWIIALAPLASVEIDPIKAGDYKEAGGRLVQAYTGYNSNSKEFAISRALEWGYGPLFGAWLFGKAAHRVLR
jgi:hypothetical protein